MLGKRLLYLSLLLLAQRSKGKRDDPTPLPSESPVEPATVRNPDRSRHFDCLINGRAMSVNTAFLVSGDWSCPGYLTVSGLSSATQSGYVMSLILSGS